MTVEVEYKGTKQSRSGLSAAEAYSIGAKSFSCYHNLLRTNELKVRVIDGRGKVLRVYSEARPP